jgi:hypothetical protein
MTPPVWHGVCFWSKHFGGVNVDSPQTESLIQERFVTRYLESEGNRLMKDDTMREPWMDLCEQASVEHDSDRLLLLAQEIVRLLDEKEERLKSLRLKPDDPEMPRSNSHAA